MSSRKAMCEGCGPLPAPVVDGGSLFLSPPLNHTLGVLRRTVGDLGLGFTEPVAGLLAVPLGAGAFAPLAAELPRRLMRLELEHTRAVVLPDGAAFDLAGLMAASPLSQIIARHDANWLINLMQGDRLRVYFQPIVPSHDPGNLFAYECLLRGVAKDVRVVGAGPIIGAATSAGLMFHLDRASRLAAIDAVGSAGLTTHVFINFQPTAIYNPEFACAPPPRPFSTPASRRSGSSSRWSKATRSTTPIICCGSWMSTSPAASTSPSTISAPATALSICWLACHPISSNLTWD